MTQDNIILGPWGTSVHSKGGDDVSSTASKIQDTSSHILSPREQEDRKIIEQQLEFKIALIIEVVMAYTNEFGVSHQQVWSDNRQESKLASNTEQELMQSILEIDENSIKTKPKYSTALLGEYISRKEETHMLRLRWDQSLELTMDALIEAMIKGMSS